FNLLPPPACRPFCVAFQSDRSARSPNGNEAGATFSLGSDQAARSPLLLADLPDTALSGGFRGAIATTVNQPDNDDPSIVEPIELAVEPGLHLDEGGRSLRQSDDRAQPALADRLHLPQGHRLGPVLPVHRA